VGAPSRKALNPDDVTIPDLHKIIRPLRAAEKHKLVLPAGRRRIWASEISWDSSPPDPDGVPEKTRALWIPRMFQILSDQGVDSIFWFLVRDMAPEPSFAATYQSGLYLRDGTPKPSREAFRFPVSKRYAKGKRLVWTRFPADGTIVFERDAEGEWRELARVAGTSGQVVRRSFRLSRGVTVRVRFA
jgi:hypothetical protein